MANLDKYLSLKKRVETAQREADEAEGAIKQELKQIKEEFGCNSVGEVVKLLKRLKKQKEVLRKSFDKAVKQFEESWDNVQT